MDKLIKQARQLLAQGVYDQNTLFNILYPKSGKHYNTVRVAIHRAKTGIFS